MTPVAGQPIPFNRPFMTGGELSNIAQAYANGIVPEARGGAQRVDQRHRGQRAQREPGVQVRGAEAGQEDRLSRRQIGGAHVQRDAQI